MHTLRRSAWCILAGSVVLGCSEHSQPPTAIDAGALSALLSQGQGQGQAHAPVGRNFVAPLSGAEEVPAADTRAHGMARFQLSRTGDALEFQLTVANLHNVAMAHIHMGARGVNGPVVVWLYPDAPPPQLIPGRTSGILASGTITAARLSGPLANGTLEDLLELIRDGEAYVNVHTSQFPGGEIRGQIRALGPGS